MALDPRKVESVRKRQRAVFTKATDRRTYNLSITEIAEASGLDDSSVSNYAGGVTTMSMVAFDALFDVVPDELLAKLLPGRRAIIQLPDGISHDDLAALMVDYLAEKQRAHHPDSEAGPAIGPGEYDRLTAKALKLVKVAA